MGGKRGGLELCCWRTDGDASEQTANERHAALWQEARAATGQTAIKIPPTGPEGDHKGLFDTTMSYIGSFICPWHLSPPKELSLSVGLSNWF
ncbi:hypothetical protein NQZ68_010996 [Dissostichus eleginoides]|nr:hypothetical protein NQZ68_010996 [Dissostichus eleginoides]